jgi:tetratricopeptide (TPR) repeat protein
MHSKPRSSNVLLLLPSILAIALTAAGQSNVRQPAASVTILDSTKEQDGLIGSVRRVKTESAKLELKDGHLVEGARQLIEVTTYALTGNRIENVSYPVSNSSVGREEYKYDDKGHIIEMTLRADGGAILSREAYDYEFDRFGNWTKMITSLVVFEDGKLKREPIEVTYRTLTYYYDDSIATAVTTGGRKKTAAIPPPSTPLQASAARADTSPAPLKNSEPSASISVPTNTPGNRVEVKDEKLASSVKSDAVKELRPAPVELVESEPLAKETPAHESKRIQPRVDTNAVKEQTSPPAKDSASGTSLSNSLKPAGASSGTPSQPAGEVKATTLETKTPSFGAKTVATETRPPSAGTKPPTVEPKTPPAAAKTVPEVKPTTTENGGVSALAMSNYKKGTELFQVGDMNGAVTAYLQAIDQEPKSAEYRLALGHAYLKLQKDKEAAKALKESVRLNPDVAEAHYGLGLAYYRLTKQKEALDEFKKATVLQPEMAKAHYGLALVYQELDKQDALVEEYRILQRLDSNLARQLAQAFPDFNLQCRVPPFCKK